MTRLRVAAVVAACLSLAACTPANAKPQSAAWHARPAASGGAAGGQAPSPTAEPSPSPSLSPSPARPSPTPAQSSSSKPSTDNRKPASGSGPAGSIITTGSSAVALTFDDGPDPTYTPKMLDLLKQYHVHATFCVVGFRARDNPALIKRIVAEGHSLCNHSWQHLFDLGQRSPGYIRNDMTETLNAIHAAVPGAKVSYFRAPGGNFTPTMVSVAKSLGMTPLYWYVDPRDWDSATYGHGTPMVNHIISAVEKNVRPGAIILSHDLAKPDTITAYRTLIPWLLARYTLIPLPT